MDFFRGEIANLKEHIESDFSVQITDGSLRAAIKLHNQTRQLMRDLYELKKRDRPPITGAQTLAVYYTGGTNGMKNVRKMNWIKSNRWA